MVSPPADARVSFAALRRVAGRNQVEPGAEASEGPMLPAVLATEVELIRAQLAPGVTGAELLRYVDAAVLNLCEHVAVEFTLLNRVMAMRAAAELLSRSRDDPAADDAEAAPALARAEAELDALVAALALARPSALTVALGRGW